MRRVGALFAAWFDQTQRRAALQWRLKEELRRPIGHQPRAEIAQDGEVKAGIEQLYFRMSPEGV